MSVDRVTLMLVLWPQNTKKRQLLCNNPALTSGPSENKWEWHRAAATGSSCLPFFSLTILLDRCVLLFDGLLFSCRMVNQLCPLSHLHLSSLLGVSTFLAQHQVNTLWVSVSFLWPKHIFWAKKFPSHRGFLRLQFLHPNFYHQLWPQEASEALMLSFMLQNKDTKGFDMDFRLSQQSLKEQFDKLYLVKGINSEMHSALKNIDSISIQY